jgi:hypothetical protein
MTKPKAKQELDILVRKLRAAGWRVRNGGWPTTLKEEARWDFCRPGENVLYPMTPEAGRVIDALVLGEPIPARASGATLPAIRAGKALFHRRLS